MSGCWEWELSAEESGEGVDLSSGSSPLYKEAEPAGSEEAPRGDIAQDKWALRHERQASWRAGDLPGCLSAEKWK